MEDLERNKNKRAIRLDDLKYKNLFIYQRGDMPCFTMDSVLLSDFADLKANDSALDIGAGTGALAILNNARTGAAFCCIEKEAKLCQLLLQSITYNGLKNISVVNADWADATDYLGYEKYTAALCNPPYNERGTKSPIPLRAVARGYEDALKGAVIAASKLLKLKGRLFMCYPAKSVDEAFYTLKDFGFSVKRLRLVTGAIENPPYLALIMAIKGGGPGITLLPSLVLNDDKGQYTKELRSIYHMEDE